MLASKKYRQFSDDLQPERHISITAVEICGAHYEADTGVNVSFLFSATIALKV